MALRERNANKDTRPSAKLSYARVSVQKACFVLDAIRGKDVTAAAFMASIFLSRLASANGPFFTERDIGSNLLDYLIVHGERTQIPNQEREKCEQRYKAFC